MGSHRLATHHTRLRNNHQGHTQETQQLLEEPQQKPQPPLNQAEQKLLRKQQPR